MFRPFVKLPDGPRGAAIRGSLPCSAPSSPPDPLSKPSRLVRPLPTLNPPSSRASWPLPLYTNHYQNSSGLPTAGVPLPRPKGKRYPSSGPGARVSRPRATARNRAPRPDSLRRPLPRSTARPWFNCAPRIQRPRGPKPHSSPPVPTGCLDSVQPSPALKLETSEHRTTEHRAEPLKRKFLSGVLQHRHLQPLRRGVRAATRNRSVERHRQLPAQDREPAGLATRGAAALAVGSACVPTTALPLELIANRLFDRRRLWG